MPASPLTDTIPRHDTQHHTPIFDQLVEEWGRRPGTLGEKSEAEMLVYAAEMAAHPNPQVQHSKVLDKLAPTVRQQPVHVITVVPLATRLPDPEPTDTPAPPQDPEEPQDSAGTPKPRSSTRILLERLTNPTSS